MAEAVEKHSILRARRALERAEVAILVLDAPEGIIAQDTHIAGYVVEACKGLVVAVNKWDLVPHEEASKKSYAHYVATRLRFTPWASVEFVSAKEGWGVRTLLDAALAAGAERRRRIATAAVNTVVRRAVGEHTASRRGQQVKVLYATQANVNPPTFVFFVNDPKLVHFSYRRYLENALRRAFGFEGTALSLVFKGRGEGRD